MNSALKTLLRDHYRDLQGYVSAGMEAGKDPSKIYMNANENPYELPGLAGENRYPEPQPQMLREGYAALYGVSPDQIVMTRGADEAIVILTKLFCEPHKDSVLICPPTFGMYSVDAKAMPCGVVEVPLVKEEGTFKLDVSAIIQAADQVKLIYLCCPNNPTGTVFSAGDMLKICRETVGRAVVVVDETYIEFAEQESLTAMLNDVPNLIILRTLSKSYSMAGIRMGVFLCGDRDFVALVCKKALDAYPLPRAGIEAALHVMKPDIQAQARDNIKKLIAGRKTLEAAFAASPCVRHIYPSETNFFLVEMDRAAEFIRHCADHNIILRDFTAKPYTTDCVRVSVGLPAENERLVRMLEKF